MRLPEYCATHTFEEFYRDIVLGHIDPRKERTMNEEILNTETDKIIAIDTEALDTLNIPGTKVNLEADGEVIGYVQDEEFGVTTPTLQ